MINILLFSILSPEIIISFVLGLAIAVVGNFIHRKIRYNSLRDLKDIGRLNHSDSAPLFTLINNMPDSVFIKDINNKYVIANESFCSILKAQHISDVIGKSDNDFYDNSIAQKYNSEDRLILSGEKEELKREQKSGDNDSIKYTYTRKYPLKNKKGKIIGIVGICSDVTEQNLANDLLTKKNEEIEKEKSLLRTLIDNMPDTIYIKDKECKFLDANTAQIEVTKANSREQILGKTDFDFYTKEVAEMFHADDKQILDTGKAVINKEEMGFDKEGNIKIRSTTKVPFTDENGKILGLVGIGRDITQLKETEEKLIEQAQSLQEVNVLLEERQEEIKQQSEELSENNDKLESEKNLLRTVLDSIPDSIYIKDKSSSFITANKNMLELFHVDNYMDIIGKSDFDYYPKEMAKQFFADEQKIISTGNPITNVERTGLDAEGNIMHMLSTKVPYKNINGEVEGIVGIIKDITKIKETELKLQEQADYLNEVNVLIEERQEEIQQQSEELSAQNTILENERNLLRTLIDNIPDSIYIKDTNSRFVTANKSLRTKLKIEDVAEIEGKTDFDFYSREQASKFREVERQVIENNSPVINKIEEKDLDNGEKKYRNITKVPYYDDNGRIAGIVGITKDITELKNYQNKLELQADDLKEINHLLEERSEEILKQSEWLAEQNKVVEEERSLLRTLIDNMPDFIYIKDRESRFITANRRLVATMKSKSLEEIIGKTDFDLSPSKEAAQEYYKDELNIIKTGNSLVNKEEIGFDEEGRKKVVSTTKVPFKDADGKIIGIVGIGRDITKQKNNEKKLIEQAESLNEVNALLEERQEKIQLQTEVLNKQANELKTTNSQLEELNATKNKFFSIIAHDLKNPFQAIFGFSELLMRNFEDFDEQQRIELLGMIKTSSESAYNLLENLLQWARTQTERISYTPTDINIHEIIEQNIKLSQPTADKKSIKIKSDFKCTNTVWADNNMVNLIIRNLTSNAIKFTTDNGTITIGCSPYAENECLVSITDTGIGISKENIKKLFRIDEYFSTTGTAGENGTGLGLIICKEFIEKNKGKFMVESELKKGTTFSFTLPLAKD